MTLKRAFVLAALAVGMHLASRVVFPQRAEAQSAEEIVAKVLAARGGLEKAKAVKSQRITGTIYFSTELYGPFVAEFKRPGKMHNEVTIQNKTVVRVFNGRDGGWVINPFAGKEGVQTMSADEIKDAMNESDFDGPLIDSKAKGMTIDFGGMEKVEGRDAYILKVTHKDGKVSNYSFDAKTYLLARWSGVDTVNSQEMKRETLFHDYREVSGLKFAFELVSNDAGNDVTQRILVEKVEVDPQIDDSHFEKPQTPAPAAAGGPGFGSP